MSFCSQVVKGGRTFSRRVFDLCAKAKCKGVIRLNDEIIEDLKWWKDFCSVFNCKNIILNDNAELPMYSDSSLQGFGAWSGKDYLYGMWSGGDTFDPGCGHYTAPPKYDNLHVHEGNINVYELFPVLAGLKRWSHRYKNSFIPGYPAPGMRCYRTGFRVITVPYVPYRSRGSGRG